MDRTQWDALVAMGSAGAVFTDRGWLWRQDVRESTAAAAAILRCRAEA